MRYPGSLRYPAPCVRPFLCCSFSPPPSSVLLTLSPPQEPEISLSPYVCLNCPVFTTISRTSDTLLSSLSLDSLCPFHSRPVGSLSKPCPLKTGVPQGFVLGPLVFSLFTKSLGYVITSHAVSTQLFLSFPPSYKPLIAHASHNVWQTSALGLLPIT